MTRINVGIPPAELCDQHLMAEIRELPRAIGKHIKVKPPDKCKLGTGHVAWCAQHQRSLMIRLTALCDEAKHRGLSGEVRLRRHPHNDRAWTIFDARAARAMMRDRIAERLEKMATHKKSQHHPRWTRRPVPHWASRMLSNAE